MESESRTAVEPPSVCPTCQHTPLYCRCNTAAAPSIEGAREEREGEVEGGSRVYVTQKITRQEGFPTKEEGEGPKDFLERVAKWSKAPFTTQDILDVMVAMQEGPIREIFVRNNAAYAETDRTDDGFNNFREGAVESGITVEQYWSVLFGKHRRALAAFIRTGKSHKPIWRVLKDMIVYLHMLNAYLIEQGRYSFDDVLSDKDDG